MPSQGGAQFIIEDGIIAWFDGPEWDEVAETSMKQTADDVKSYAQANAPWEDRTGQARSGLDTNVANDDGVIELQLFHTVDYGLWLEVIQNGNYAIILPTLELYAPQAFAKASNDIANARRGRDL